MLKDEEIISKFIESKRIAENHFSKQYKENNINYAFYSGNKEIAFKEYNIKPSEVVYFNYIHPVINAVEGFIIQHRRMPQCFAKSPVIEEQKRLSQYVNSISSTYRNNANFDNIESQQDLDMLVCGYGAVDIVITYENIHGSDPYGQGEISIENIDVNDVWWDITAKKTNISDARYIARKKNIYKEDVEAIFNIDFDKLSLEGDDDSFSYGEWKDINNEGAYKAERPLEYVAGTKNKQVVVYEYQWWQYEKNYRLENPIFTIADDTVRLLVLKILQTMDEKIAEEEDYTKDRYNIDLNQSFISLNKKRYNFFKKAIKLLEEQLSIYIPIEAVEYDTRCYYTALISGKIILDKYKNIHQSGFTIKVKTAYFDKGDSLWFGICSLMREPAKYNAKALTEILKSVSKSTKSGLLVEKSATDDPAELEYRYRKQDAVVWLNDGGIGKIKEKQTPPLPSGYENIAINSENAIRKITNITPELLGNTENKNATAALERQRIKQAMTSLAVFFDSISLYQTESLRQMIDYIRVLAENSPDKLVRIIGQDGMNIFAPLIADNLKCEFDVDIGEAPDSPTQREENINLLMQLADKFIQIGMGNIYPIVIKQLDGLTELDKQEIIEAITPKPTPPDQLEEARKEYLLKMMLAETDKTNAEALDKQFSALERKAQISKIINDIDFNKTKMGIEKMGALNSLYDKVQPVPILNEQTTNEREVL